MAKGMGSDSPVQLQSYLKGIDYPTDKETLVKTARRNKAPENVLQVINELPEDEFASPVDVMKAYGEINKGSNKGHGRDDDMAEEGDEPGMHAKKRAGNRGRGG